MCKTGDSIRNIRLLAIIAVSVTLPLVGHAQSGTAISGRAFSIQAQPILTVPLVGSAELFETGGGTAFSGSYVSTGGAFRPDIGLRLEYSLAPFKAEDTLSVVSLEASGGYSIELAPRLDLRASMTAGWFYGLVNSDGSSGANPALSAGFNLSFIASRSLDLGISASYRNYIGLYHGVSVALGASVYLSGGETRLARIDAASPVRAELLAGARADKPGSGLDIERIEIDELFPVFRSYYDDKPVGRILVINRENHTIDGIKLSFFMKQFMDAPKDCPAPPSLGARESLMMDLSSLFTENILEVTEATKANAEIILEYMMGGEQYRAVRNATVRILDRNAMRWTDDRRAAAFVTAKDPRILAFAKNVAGIIRDSGPKAVDRNLLTGMGMFQALDLYGLSYVVDPKTPYVEFSKTGGTVDYLQFPRQTLEYRAGDCDDLSILFAALLESVGVETSFVTVPGHIYMAFALDIDPGEVPRIFSNPGELIIRGGKAWIPVEVTERKEGFLSAWQQGAREWREAEAKGNAGFLPVHEAWTEYEPVGLPGTSSDISLPPTDSIAAAFLKETARYIDREIFPLIKKLESELQSGGGNQATRNKLGILYARYDRFDQAEAEFRAASTDGRYLPAILNLGNLYFLKKDYIKALDMYTRAAKLDPKHAQALLAIAMAHHELGAWDKSRTAYEKAVAINPGLAQRYAYLGGGSESAGRADDASARRGVVAWSE